MVFSRAASLSAAAALGVLAACSAPDPTVTPGNPASRTGASAPGDVVAEVNGTPITRAELDERAAPALARIRQEEYEILSGALDELIAERLIESEAAGRGVSTDELVKEEVTRRVTPPSSAQVAMLYEQNRDRFGTQSREEAIARIEEVLMQRATAERQQRFTASLRESGEVAVHLDPPRAEIQVPPDSPVTGPENAPVTIVEFTDYQCPFCHRAQGVVDKILDEYGDDVRLVHLDFPLDNHPGAIPAARAARCAGEQGRFWDYHRSLMLETGELDQADLESRARKLDLDLGPFGECIVSDKYDADIRSELEYGSSVGVTGTPAYFINGRMVSGARPFPVFQEIIDAELD